MLIPYQTKTHYREAVKCSCGCLSWRIEREPVMADGAVRTWWRGYEPASQIRMVCADCGKSDSFSEAPIRRLVKPTWESLMCEKCGALVWTVEREDAEKPGGSRVLWGDGKAYTMKSRCAVCKQDTHHWLETQYMSKRVIGENEVPHEGSRVPCPSAS